MNSELTQQASDAGSMFLILAGELTVLFLAISFLVGALQAYLPPQKIQAILSSRGGKGYFIAAFLGAITPFCSCSTIPFLKGLLKARAGFGPMMVFLLASPLLNPIIIGLFIVTLGVDVTIFYFVIAMSVSVIAGYTLEKLNFERFVKESAYNIPSPSSCSKNSGCGNASPADKNVIPWRSIWNNTWKDFKQVLPYLLVGIAIGSVIYGFIPTEFIAKYAGEQTWQAVVIAAVIGIPLYIRAEAVIPLSAALVKKGMAMGSVMALVIGSAGASLTEVILLKSIFKAQLILAFLTVIIGMAISAGLLYNLIGF